MWKTVLSMEKVCQAAAGKDKRQPDDNLLMLAVETHACLELLFPWKLQGLVPLNLSTLGYLTKGLQDTKE